MDSHARERFLDDHRRHLVARANLAEHNGSKSAAAHYRAQLRDMYGEESGGEAEELVA